MFLSQAKYQKLVSEKEKLEEQLEAAADTLFEEKTKHRYMPVDLHKNTIGNGVAYSPEFLEYMSDTMASPFFQFFLYDLREGILRQRTLDPDNFLGKLEMLDAIMRQMQLFTDTFKEHKDGQKVQLSSGQEQ